MIKRMYPMRDAEDTFLLFFGSLHSDIKMINEKERVHENDDNSSR